MATTRTANGGSGGGERREDDSAAEATTSPPAPRTGDFLGRHRLSAAITRLNQEIQNLQINARHKDLNILRFSADTKSDGLDEKGAKCSRTSKIELYSSSSVGVNSLPKPADGQDSSFVFQVGRIVLGC